MVKRQGKPFKQKRSSTKSRPKQLESPYLEKSEDRSPDICDGPVSNSKFGQKSSSSKSAEMLSTTDFVSKAAMIWNRANESLALLRPRTSVRPAVVGSEKGSFVYSLAKATGLGGSVAATGDHDCLGSNTSHRSSCNANQHSCTDAVSRDIPVESCSPRSWRYSQNIFSALTNSSMGMRCAHNGIPLNFRLYEWMRQVNTSDLRLPVVADNCCDNDTDCCTSSHADQVCSSQRNENSLWNHTRDECEDFAGEVAKPNNISNCKESDIFKNKSPSVSSLSSDYFLGIVKEPQKEVISHDSNPRHCANFDGVAVQTGPARVENNGKLKNEELSKSVAHANPYVHFDGGDKHVTEISADQILDAVAKKEHAASGALAGVFVSLCIHPVDTVKTVIQSCRADQKSLFSIGQSIIYERGMTGLYRGIASNITASAPISAIYTFSYETVKGIMLPNLPKEYHSLAHCTAGGCASVATSFVFTPSERIKQQMQVSSRYQNCWNAFVRIIEKGGLPSLYAGWGAVLCRNVPHSIIKFYTYESLKQNVLSLKHPGAQLSSWQTLLCGGVAGSTAALFSTPFDVVKTRLQTQIPGSVRPYRSVFNALQEIRKHEGIKGLYRGLTPRLVMYISQGSLFFTSYEFFKGVLSLDKPLRSTQNLSL